jgi:D-beta-D-heptose 7-phosphate kinase/D-beta-D-heptose 1-phosphate adenosyltransferase
MEYLAAAAVSLNVPLVVDPKPPNFALYKNIDGITPNLNEASHIINKKIENTDDAAAAIKYINEKFATKFSIITRGADGITAGETGKEVFHLPAFSHDVFDVTGAGDTVISVLMLAVVSGASLEEAARLANAAASIVIEKIGAAALTVDELYNRVKYLLNK